MTAHEINAFAIAQTPLAEHYPGEFLLIGKCYEGGIMGFDHEGNAVVIEAVAGVHPKTLCLGAPVSELFRLAITFGEAVSKTIRWGFLFFETNCPETTRRGMAESWA